MGVMVNDGTGTNLCSPSQTVEPVEEGLNWKLKADDGPAFRALDVEYTAVVVVIPASTFLCISNNSLLSFTVM